jgi:bifunctional non-homologous end joining protein LigD
MEEQTESVTLFFRQEKSDKVYKAAIEEKDGDFVVNFAYGRRGSTLKTGTKTQNPVPYERAKKLYDKLVNSKAAKGYVPDEDDSNYVYESDQVKTGIHCQLLNPIDEEELDLVLSSDEWWAQEKMDGRRMLIHKKAEEIIAINRKGLSIGAPEVIIADVKQDTKTFLIDGEAIGENFYVFDLLEIEGVNLRDESYSQRLMHLQTLSFGNSIKIVSTSQSKEDKQKLLKDLDQANAEGIVFKQSLAIYTPGRPNSGGAQLKYKFYDTASVIVTKVNDRRSVGMSVYEDGNLIDVGNVTIAPNKEIPQLNDIIEVRYLYAYKGGSLYQPTFLMTRDDLNPEDCLMEQLKFKPE